jgi:hypothetical protein
MMGPDRSEQRVSLLEFLGLVVLAAWIVLPTLLVVAFVFDWISQARKRRLSGAAGALVTAQALAQKQPHPLEVEAEVGHPEAHKVPIDPGSGRRPDDRRRE